MYVSVPEDMKGGELELLGDRETAFPNEEENEPKAIEAIAPTHNLHAEFRGDSFHRVRGYATDTSTLRISLVLEQYKLEEEDAQYLIPYVQSEKNGMTMM